MPGMAGALAQLLAEEEPSWRALGEGELVRALELAPDARGKAAAYYRLAESLRAGGQYDSAAWAYLHTHRVRPDAAAYVNLGIALHAGGRDDAAKEAFNLAIRHKDHPMSDAAAAYANLARLPGAPAAEHLEHAARIAPASADIHLALGEALRHAPAADARARGLRAFETAAHLRPTAEAMHSLGEALLGARRAAEALGPLRRARALDPSSALSAFAHGVALQRGYALDEAAAAFEAAAELHPSHATHTLRHDDMPPAHERTDAEREALEAAAAASVGAWAARARAAVDAPTAHRAASAHDPTCAEEAEEADGAEAGGEGECAVSSPASAAERSSVLAAHMASGTPVLLRGVASTWHAAANWSSWADFPSSIVAVSSTWEGGRTSRLGEVPDGLAPSVAARLAAEGVHRALYRPPLHQMNLTDYVALLNANACERCYLKQCRIDLHVPALLRHVPPPRVPGTALGDGFAWLGAQGSWTAAHHDERDNLLVMLAGAKRLTLVPPAVARAAFEPAALFDVATRPTAPGDLGPPALALPRSADAVSIDRAHYLRQPSELWPTSGKGRGEVRGEGRGSHARRAGGGAPAGVCRVEVHAPDAVFIPRGWAHEIESTGGREGGVAAAVNWFYEAEPPPGV